MLLRRRKKGKRKSHEHDKLSTWSRFLNVSSKSLKIQERKNPENSLIYLKGVVVCLKGQSLVYNAAVFFVNERFAENFH